MNLFLCLPYASILLSSSLVCPPFSPPWCILHFPLPGVFSIFPSLVCSPSGLSLYHKDMNHMEREKSGIPSSHPRSRPLPNPSATVFVSNVSENHTPCMPYIQSLHIILRCAPPCCYFQLEYSVSWQKIKDVFKVAGKYTYICMTYVCVIIIKAFA